MRRANPVLILILVLLLAQAGHGEGSFNRVSASTEAEAPASEPAQQPASEPAPESPVATAVPAATAPAEASPEPQAPRGKACIYGPNGLLHQPRGKQCAQSAAPPASADPAPGGRCILGTDGEVVYAPPGVSCEQTLLNEPLQPRAPRVRRFRY